VQRRLSRRLQPFPGFAGGKNSDVAKDLPEKIEQVVPCSLGLNSPPATAWLREMLSSAGHDLLDFLGRSFATSRFRGEQERLEPAAKAGVAHPVRSRARSVVVALAEVAAIPRDNRAARSS